MRRFLGITFKSRAVLDVSIDELPSGSPGSIAELEPTAIIHFLKAIVSIIGRDDPPKNIGIENDHITLDMRDKIGSIFSFSVFKNVSKDLMKLRMIKSKEL